MNIKPFLTLASERLAGTPTCREEKPRAPVVRGSREHLPWGEAESTCREEKPKAPAVRRSREHLPWGEAESTCREEKPSVQPKIEGFAWRINLVNLFRVFLVPVVRTYIYIYIYIYIYWEKRVIFPLKQNTNRAIWQIILNK